MGSARKEMLERQANHFRLDQGPVLGGSESFPFLRGSARLLCVLTGGFLWFLVGIAWQSLN